MITGDDTQTDAHHLLRAEDRGVAYKTGDNWLVPLSHTMHTKLHTQYGDERKFFKNFGYDYEDVMEYARMLWQCTCDNTEPLYILPLV